jgi:uncharacterized protein YjiS (DUF1127 family)
MKTATAIQTLDSTAPPVLGIVKNTYPRVDTTRPAVNDDDFSGAAELDAWARRTFAANGFGDAEVAPAAAAGSVGDPRRRASIAQIVLAIGTAIADAAGRLVARWRERREMRGTYKALAELDAQTLKDIGFGPHEAGSIAAELAGRAERTRMQALRTLQFLSI